MVLKLNLLSRFPFSQSRLQEIEYSAETKWFIVLNWMETMINRFILDMNAYLYKG